MIRPIAPSAVLARVIGAGALAGLILTSGGAWAAPPAAAGASVIQVADSGGYGSSRQALSGAELAANRGAGLQAGGIGVPHAGIVLWDETAGRVGALSSSLPPGAASSAASAGSGP